MDRVELDFISDHDNDGDDEWINKSSNVPIHYLEKPHVYAFEIRGKVIYLLSDITGHLISRL